MILDLNQFQVIWQTHLTHDREYNGFFSQAAWWNISTEAFPESTYRSGSFQIAQTHEIFFLLLMSSGALWYSCFKSAYRQNAVHYEIESVRVPKERVELYRSKRLSIPYDLTEMQKAADTLVFFPTLCKILIFGVMRFFSHFCTHFRVLILTLFACLQLTKYTLSFTLTDWNTKRKKVLWTTRPCSCKNEKKDCLFARTHRAGELFSNLRKSSFLYKVIKK